MRFAGIDLPQDLISAHAGGDVVFFVGAGASMPSPTGLPRFGELTQSIAKLAGAEPPSWEDLKEPDVFLGRLDADPAVDVHRFVAQEIGRKRRRNRVHDALAVLAAAPGAPRLVTTNYDDHLHRALAAQGIGHTVFEAPALPSGNDFEGLVHLHGRVGQRPDRLVVTDADFGTAYVTRGWAPAFLRDVFSQYVVCFVGYSHDDRMMDYLAKGLPSNAQPRFIITDVADRGRWERLRITPILYASGEHERVIDVLERWGAWARDTPFDRAGRIRLLAGVTPPADPDDHDLLVASVDDPILAREVCAIARGDEWVDWMVQRGPFRALIGDGESAALAEARQQVALWVADQAVADEQMNRIYHAVTSSTGLLDPLLSSAILGRIGSNEVEPSVRSIWLRWAIGRPDLGPHGRLELELLWGSPAALSWQDAMLLLDLLANGWTPGRRSPFGWVDAPGLHLEFGLAEGIGRLRPAPDSEALRELLNWLTAYFEQAHRRVALHGRDYDGWSYSRLSIGTHGQDRHSAHEPESVLIDLARDTLADARVRAAESAAVIAQAWLASRTPLLRRLALHDLATAESDPGRQVGVLVERDLLTARGVRHEVFEVLAAAAPRLTDDQFAALVAQVASIPVPAALDESGAPDDRRRDRVVYDLLHWLARNRQCPEPPAEIATIQQRHPDWKEDDHPDFTRFMTSGSTSLQDEWPWQPEEFHAMVLDDPRAALDRLREHPPTEPDIGWWGAGNLLERVVGEWAEDGLSLWPIAHVEERACVLGGWATAPMSDNQLDRVAQEVGAVELHGLDREVARLLRPWTNDGAIADRWVRRADGRALARRLPAALGDTRPSVAGVDPYSEAINSTPGTLTEFWIGAAVADARAGTYPGGGLSGEVASALEELLAPSGFVLLVQAPLMLHVNFLFRADPVWTREHLLPLLNPYRNAWSDIEGLWGVVLSGQFSDDLLQEGLLDWVPEVARRSRAEPTIARALARVGALITVQSTIDDATRLSWLTRFVVCAEVDLAVSWINEVTELVSDLEPEARASVWRRWMLPYLRQRAKGSPRALSPEETTALIGWLTAPVDARSLGEGVDCVIAAGTGLASSNTMWRGLDVSDDVLSRSPNEWSRLFAALLTNTPALPGGLDRWLSRAVVTLESAGAAGVSLEAIRRQMFRLGCGRD